MSRYVNPKIQKRDDDMDFASFRRAFPELAEPALKAEREAGRKDGHAKGYSEGFAAGKAAAAPSPKPLPPTAAELEKVEAALPVDERARCIWFRDPEIRAQYKVSGFAGFVATLRHEAKTARRG